MRRYKTMQHALTLIAGRCEKVTSTTGWCPTQSHLTPDCPYGADRWCDACIARVGLRGRLDEFEVSCRDITNNIRTESL